MSKQDTTVISDVRYLTKSQTIFYAYLSLIITVLLGNRLNPLEVQCDEA